MESRRWSRFLAASLLAACTGTSPPPTVATRADLAFAVFDAGESEVPGKAPVSDFGSVTVDASTPWRPACEWGGAPGSCLSSTTCAGLADHTAKSGSCRSWLVCCIVTPSVMANPSIPLGYKPMMNAQVTAAMTMWAVAILRNPIAYPMFATATMRFGTVEVLARVEWHPPDFQNSIVHRGVTLYLPTM
jgi:hypothetical protein